ncbi:MAG: hypothetical protein ACOCQ1_03780 [Halanaerobiaceae bacterium]
MRQKGLVLVLMLVLVAGMTSGVLAAGSEDSDTFDINVNVLQGISISITDGPMDFGDVYTGAGEQTASVNADVTGEAEESYTLSFPDLTDSQVELDDDSGNIINVGLSSDGSGTLDTNGEESVAITGTIDSTELEDAETGEYTGNTTVEVVYDN